MNNEDNNSPELLFAKLKNDQDFSVKSNIPYAWMGTHWKEIQLEDLEREALLFLASKAPAKANERLATSAAKTAILFGKRMGEPDHTFIPTLSGYIQINGEVVKHSPANKDLGITYVLDCNYESIADCPTFRAFLVEALPDAGVRNFIQEYAGYTLLGDARHQLAAWLIGDGGTGKGTFAHIMSALHRQTVALSINSLDGFKLSGLQSASLVYVDETPARIDEERLKTLVSGDPVQIDRKYRDAITIRPTAKWIISGNALPSISDQSDGFWRRWFVFPFDIKPKEKKPLLAESIIEKELSGVLNWAIVGLQRLLIREAFPALPEAMREAMASGKRQSNSVAEWVEDDGILFDGEVKNSRADVYARYSFWCSESGSRAVGSPKFWERLRQIFAGIPEDRNADRKTVGGKRKAMVNIAIPFN